MRAGMRRTVALALTILALAAAPLHAQTVITEEIIEDEITVPASGNGRFLEAHPSSADPQLPKGIAAFGPFRVLDSGRAALVGVTNATTPGEFTAMLRAFPGIRTIDMVECPGTDDDRANLRLGMMVRERGIATHVPKGGSVRSGAVELFLSGARHSADPEAEFAVHSWVDEFGLQPKDFAPDAPENRAYLDYYRMMGMTDAEATAFYAMTNSVPNADAKWMTGTEMAQWVRLDPADAPGARPASLASAVLDSGRAVH
jgi:hypothetical protein